MADREALTQEVRELRIRGALTVAQRSDDEAAHAYPELARLVRSQTEVEAGELGTRIVAMVTGAARSLASPAWREIAPNYLALPGTPGGAHKAREIEAAKTLGQLERGQGYSPSTFRQKRMPELVAEVVSALVGEEPRRSQGELDPGVSGQLPSHSDWPVSALPLPRQDIVVLIATARMREGPGAPLIRLVRELEPYFRATRPLIYALNGSYSAIWRAGLFHDYEPGFVRLPPGVEGGLVYATEIVLRAGTNRRAFVVYLIDPRDPTALYPATAALKRECLLTRTPFLTSCPGALRWFRLEWARAAYENRGVGAALEDHLLLTPEQVELAVADGGAADRHGSVALAAHDRHKVALMRFAERFDDLLSSGFSERYATHVSGHLLNGGERTGELMHDFGLYDMSADEKRRALDEIAQVQGRLGSRPTWTRLMTHGRHGGVIQLARKILDGDCTTCVFFQDARTPREHDHGDPGPRSRRRATHC